MIVAYRVRYGTTTYTHPEDSEAMPLPFRLQLERAEGLQVQGSEGIIELDPEEPESSYAFLKHVLHSGREPDAVEQLVHETGRPKVRF